MKRLWFTLFCVASPLCLYAQQTPPNADKKPEKVEKVVKKDAEWRKQLTPIQYAILRRKATEPAFRNAFWKQHEAGTYSCAGCKHPLFSSETKFDSGTGWPSFWKPLTSTSTRLVRDADGERVEVVCARCDGHLGHLFDDATGEYGIPKTPTGMRYCMNSGAMLFTAKKK